MREHFHRLDGNGYQCFSQVGRNVNAVSSKRHGPDS
jgi:hypothetical protein